MASNSGTGRADREGISLTKLFQLFPDDDAAEQWFEECRWPGGHRVCPDCGESNYSITKDRQPGKMPYRCRACRRYFSVKKGTVMQSSPIGYQKWAIATYIVVTNLKGASSMKLHRDLEISQQAAWHLSHRIRKALADGKFSLMAGPVEVDEGFFGGLERNKHASKKLRAGRGAVGKTAVVAAKDRATNRVDAQVVSSVAADSLQPFVIERTREGSTVFTDDHGAYRGIPGVEHRTVRHSVGEYVDGMAHTNGVESFWSMLKRGYHGTFHHVSPKHLQRYVDEFSGRHNLRSLDTIDQMASVVRGMVGKRLRYADLTE